MIKAGSQKDVGYAWVVLCAGIGALIMCGITLCNGTFNLIFLEEFGQSKSFTAWCGGLQLGLLNTAGILGGFLLIRFDTRTSMVVGGTLVFSGFAGCYFAKSLYAVLLFYGIIAGTGFGVIYTTVIVSMGHYFSKYQNTAFGIVSAGVGIGLMLFSPLLDVLVEQYHWRGAVLILSAILANLYVCAALMRPVETKSSDKEFVQPRDVNIDYVEKAQHDEIPVQSSNNKIQIDANQLLISEMFEGTLAEYKYIENQRDYKIPSEAYVSLREDTQENELNMNHCQMSKTKPLMSCEENSTCKQECTISHQKQEPLFLKIKRSPLCSVKVGGYFVNICLLSVGVSATFTHFPVYISNLTGHHTMLLTLIGIVNIFSRPAYGLLVNKFPSQLIAIYNTSCLIAGVAIILLPLICSSKAGEYMFAMLFASFGNAFIPLMAPTTVKLIGIEHLEMSYGIGCFICGFGYIFGPVIAGWCFDISGLYTYSFVLAGGCYVLACFVMIVTTRLDVHREERKGHREHLACS